MATSNAEGVPVTAIASNGYISAGSKGSGVLVRPDSGISSVADLAGKTIGVQGVRSGSDLAVLLAAEDAGIDPDSLVQVALPFPAMLAALESGQVDAVMAVDPFFSQISAAGMENLGNMQAQFTPDVPSTVWATTDNWLAENAETAEKFAAAMEDAVAYYEDPANLDEVREITAEISQTDIEKVTKVLPTISVSFKRQAASDNLSALSRLGYLTKDVTFEDMVWDRAPMN
ncbi:ABC transporter substrate-binding protein [Arthrobacter koreensis]|nr:ABC transporter substrate-binding protein [Arthrobacter koreensis]